MAQVMLTAQFASGANAPYNLWKVLAGIQTAGVTLKTGAAVKDKSLPVNQSLIRITPTTEVAGKLYFGDSTVSAANKNGTPIAAGDSLSLGTGVRSDLCIFDKWFDIDTNNMVVALEVS